MFRSFPPLVRFFKWKQRKNRLLIISPKPKKRCFNGVTEDELWAMLHTLVGEGVIPCSHSVVVWCALFTDFSLFAFNRGSMWKRCRDLVQWGIQVSFQVIHHALCIVQLPNCAVGRLVNSKSKRGKNFHQVKKLLVASKQVQGRQHIKQVAYVQCLLHPHNAFVELIIQRSQCVRWLVEKWIKGRAHVFLHLLFLLIVVRRPIQVIFRTDFVLLCLRTLVAASRRTWRWLKEALRQWCTQFTTLWS